MTRGSGRARSCRRRTDWAPATDCRCPCPCRYRPRGSGPGRADRRCRAACRRPGSHRIPATADCWAGAGRTPDLGDVAQRGALLAVRRLPRDQLGTGDRAHGEHEDRERTERRPLPATQPGTVRRGAERLGRSGRVPHGRRAGRAGRRLTEHRGPLVETRHQLCTVGRPLRTGLIRRVSPGGGGIDGAQHPRRVVGLRGACRITGCGRIRPRDQLCTGRVGPGHSGGDGGDLVLRSLPVEGRQHHRGGGVPRFGCGGSIAGGGEAARLRPGDDRCFLDLFAGTPEQVLEYRAPGGGHDTDHARADEGSVDAELACEIRRGSRGDRAAGHLSHAQVYPLLLLLRVGFGFYVHLQPLIAPSIHLAWRSDHSEYPKVPILGNL